jgi:asparagine synthetase B (glutamine-hydrolysing)
MIDKILEEIVREQVPDKEVAVLLSGGTDSLSLALTAHRLGKKVHAYTFHLEGNETYDAKKANDTSTKMGWECTTVVVPSIITDKDFFTLKNTWKCVKKTHYECTYPFMYIYPKIEEKYILSGIAADGHYGVSKRACMHFKQPKSLFDTFREDYFGQQNPAGLSQQQYLSFYYDKTFVAPYLDQRVLDFFRKYDWFELNKPFQKHHVIESFPEFQQIGRPKAHINLQLGANVDKAFEKLLESDIINFKKRKRMLDVYRDWKTHEQVRTLFD